MEKKFDDNGTVVTNYHVIEGGTSILLHLMIELR